MGRIKINEYMLDVIGKVLYIKEEVKYFYFSFINWNNNKYYIKRTIKISYILLHCEFAFSFFSFLNAHFHWSASKTSTCAL